MSWRLINRGKAGAKENMEEDARLLLSLRSEDAPTFHVYDWKAPSATYGHFIQPAQFFHLDKLASYSLQLSKRPTGGGILFHTGDLTFSVLIPASHPAYSLNTLENYRFVNAALMRAVEHFQGKHSQLLPEPPQAVKGSEKHFCMAHPTQYDVMLGGKKVGGAAQRRTKEGFLHQGSLSLRPVDEEMVLAVLQDGEAILDAMRQNSTFILQGTWSHKQIEEAKEELRGLLFQELSLNIF